jgi:hypothetical protein
METLYFDRGRSNLVLAVSLFTLLILTAAERVNAALPIIYVDASAGGAGNGANWCNAFTSLQDGLAASGGNTAEIRVARGVYRPDVGSAQTLGDRTASFQLVDDVILRGGYGGCSAPDPNERNLALGETVLSGDLLGDDVAGDFPLGASSLDNSYHVLWVGGQDNSTLEGFTIRDGRAAGVSPHDAGGALRIDFANCILQKSFLVANYATYGGAVHNNGGRLTSFDSQLAGNVAGKWGGALDNFSATAVLVNSLVIGNLAGSLGTGEGGGIHSDFSTLTVTNSTIVDNTAGNRGGGIFNYAGVTAQLTNLIVWGNVDSSGGSEAAQIFNNPSNALFINHSCVEGWTGGLGGVANFASPPLFKRDPSPGADGRWDGVDDDFGDLALSATSPAINVGDNSADIDASLIGQQPLPSFDYAGQARIVDTTVDLGAIEYLPEPNGRRMLFGGIGLLGVLYRRRR